MFLPTPQPSSYTTKDVTKQELITGWILTGIAAVCLCLRSLGKFG